MNSAHPHRPQAERLTESQARALLPQLVALLTDGVEHGASIGFLRPLAKDVAMRYWDEVLREVSQGSRVLLVIREHSLVVGSVQLGLCQKPNGRHRAELQKLLVHSSARRRGHARTLMAAAETQARTERRTLLYLDTEPGQPAEALYRALGWTHAGTIPDYAATPDGDLHGTALFFKKLS